MLSLADVAPRPTGRNPAACTRMQTAEIQGKPTCAITPIVSLELLVGQRGGKPTGLTARLSREELVEGSRTKERSNDKTSVS